VIRFSGEYCPDTLDFASHEGEVTHEISGDTLIITRYGFPTNYTYAPDMGAFCREEFSELIIDKDEFNTEILDCVSFQNRHGIKTSNHRRYYDVNGTPTLCFDRRYELQSREQTGPESDSALIVQCIASPNMYQVEFTNISDEFSNESKTVCLGDFIIHNLSSEILSLRYYNISDNGAMHSEGWTHEKTDETTSGYISIEPGEKTERDFGSQKWTDGTSTIDTFTKIIVVRSSIECTNWISDENIDIWGEYAVPLNDPCR